MEKIIIKYITNSITTAELKELAGWLEIPENKELFKDYVKVNYAIDYNMSQFNLDKTKILLLNKIKEDSNKAYRIKISKVLKYAAVFLGILGITFFFQNDEDSIQQLRISDDAIILKFDNGNTEVIAASGEKKIIDKEGRVVGIQKGNELNYHDENTSNKALLSDNKQGKLVYNELIVPHGKTFQIVLSDGTKVYLNAGTSLKYPIKFIRGTSRQVFLHGEAFFDVAKDANNPFIVNANELKVKVLGTQFNISSYPEDEAISTVLIEGSVSLSGNEENRGKMEIILKPGFKASWNKIDKNISIKEVDTSIYIGWMEGRLVFKNIQFQNIIKKLERHYNVSILNNNLELNEQYYNATFDNESIEQVLNSFNKSYQINYTIENNSIIIN